MWLVSVTLKDDMKVEFKVRALDYIHQPIERLLSKGETIESILIIPQFHDPVRG